MSSVNIQFHALPEELLALATEWAKDFPLYLIAIKFPPYEAIEVDFRGAAKHFRGWFSILGAPVLNLATGAASQGYVGSRGEKPKRGCGCKSAGELRKVLANRRFQEAAKMPRRVGSGTRSGGK